MRTHGHREGSITHWGLSGGGIGEGQRGVGSWGGITWGEMPDIGNGEEGSKSHCHMCTYATILHALHMYPKSKNAIKKKEKKDKKKNVLKNTNSFRKIGISLGIKEKQIETLKYYFYLST